MITRTGLIPAFLIASASFAAAQDLPSVSSTDVPKSLEQSWPESRGAVFSLQQQGAEVEYAPIHFGLAVFARIDVPGDTSVDSFDNVAYSDIFDIGYGFNVEASLMSWLTRGWAIGGYLSVGWDRFTGASDVDMGTGEFFSFGDQDQVSVIIGGKVIQKFAPFWFWEGRMGVGLIHYGSLDFTDVTAPPSVSGLQFFRPVTHGLFDIGGRIGVGSPRVTFDVGIDFRFQGSEARGRDVTDVIDPAMFFVFTLDLGLSLRF